MLVVISLIVVMGVSVFGLVPPPPLLQCNPDLTYCGYSTPSTCLGPDCAWTGDDNGVCNPTQRCDYYNGDQTNCNNYAECFWTGNEVKCQNCYYLTFVGYCDGTVEFCETPCTVDGESCSSGAGFCCSESCILNSDDEFQCCDGVVKNIDDPEHCGSCGNVCSGTDNQCDAVSKAYLYEDGTSELRKTYECAECLTSADCPESVEGVEGLCYYGSCDYSLEFETCNNLEFTKTCPVFGSGDSLSASSLTFSELPALAKEHVKQEAQERVDKLKSGSTLDRCELVIEIGGICSGYGIYWTATKFIWKFTRPVLSTVLECVCDIFTFESLMDTLESYNDGLTSSEEMTQAIRSWITT